MGFLGPFACASFVSAQCGTSHLSTVPHPYNETTHVETAMYQVCRAVESYGMLACCQDRLARQPVAQLCGFVNNGMLYNAADLRSTSQPWATLTTRQHES